MGRFLFILSLFLFAISLIALVRASAPTASAIVGLVVGFYIMGFVVAGWIADKLYGYLITNNEFWRAMLFSWIYVLLNLGHLCGHEEEPQRVEKFLKPRCPKCNSENFSKSWSRVPMIISFSSERCSDCGYNCFHTNFKY